MTVTANTVFKMNRNIHLNEWVQNFTHEFFINSSPETPYISTITVRQKDNAALTD